LRDKAISETRFFTNILFLIRENEFLLAEKNTLFYSTYRIRKANGAEQMQKKLTITVDEKVYDGLHNIVGRRKIRQFIESLVRPHVIKHSVESAYQEMALDEAREAEALEWSESTIGDVADETWRSLVGKI